MPSSRPALLLVVALSLSVSVRAEDPGPTPSAPVSATVAPVAAPAGEATPPRAGPPPDEGAVDTDDAPPDAPPILIEDAAEIEEAPEAPPPGLLPAPAGPIEPTGRADALELVRAVVDPLRLGRFTAGIEVLRLSTGEEVFGWNADVALVPASTMKVLTAATALARLGPAYTFSTTVWRDGKVDDGVLEGDLVIVGGGDPTLTVERLWRMLREVRQGGIDRITGDLVFDDTFFDEPPIIPGWPSRRDRAEGPTYFPGIGALELEFGQAGVIVRPGGRTGAPARVEVEVPAGDYVHVHNSLVTGRRRSRTRLDLDRVVGDGTLTFALDGSINPDAGALRFHRAVPEPTPYVMAAVHELLDDVGLTVGGTLRRGPLPKGARLLERTSSAPLGGVLADMNKHSSNFIAESVLRTLGAELRGEGTTAAGLDVIREHLDGLGFDRAHYLLANGSGLTRQARVPARVLATVLREGALDPRTGPELLASLSIGGRDGTLRNRFEGAEGQVRGKTGTLADVGALAGFFEADDGELYAFAFLANDVDGGMYQVKTTIDDFLTALLRLPREGGDGVAPGLASGSRLR